MSKNQPPVKFKPFDLVFTFLCPMIVGKTLIMFMGADYSANPGAGYGYALAAAILFTLFMFGRFLWKYRHYKD